MGLRELLRWQWTSYPEAHTSRANLVLHIFTVPLFWAGTALLLASLFILSWPLAVLGAGCLLVPLVAQGLGHKRLESQPSAPFTSPWNFVARFCLEQWINFPRFVLSGGWWRAFSEDP
ncbi:MAG TPA: terminase [Gammaproteobacteria bacterium]|jgi:hypothetical protein